MDKIQIHVTRFSLHNGLSIVLAPDHRTRLAVLSVVYNLNTQDLLIRKTGLPHFTEHIIFPMSINGRKREDFGKFIFSIGAKAWAETREDYLFFSSIFHYKKFPLFLSLESRRMASLHFSQGTFLYEKEKIKKERSLLYEKRPYLHSLGELLKKGFENTPWSKDIIGTHEEIEKIKIEDIPIFHKDYFSPNNSILIVAGNININEAIELITDYFEGAPSSLKLDPFVLKRYPLTSKILLISKKTVGPAAHFAFRIFPRTRNLSHIFYILEYILNNEMIINLNRIGLNNRSIAFKVMANYLEKPILSLFVIFVHLCSCAKIKEIINIFFKSLDMIRSNLTENSIGIAKLQILSRFYAGLNSLTNITSILSECFLLDGDPTIINSEIGKIKMTNKKDILAILNEYFIPESMIFVGTNLKD